MSLLGACTQPSNPPAAAAQGPSPFWHSVYFGTNSFAIDAAGQKDVNDVIAYLQGNPAAVATVVGRTDTVGSPEYNMHLSHKRADAVRDALVYGGKLAPDRVEARWTGESRQAVPTAKNVADADNRVVDIAVH